MIAWKSVVVFFLFFPQNRSKLQPWWSDWPPWFWAHCKCAGLENGRVCISEIYWGIFVAQYISQTLPKIPDALLSKQNSGRRSEIFETIWKHLQLSIDIKGWHMYNKLIVLHFKFIPCQINEISRFWDTCRHLFIFTSPQKVSINLIFTSFVLIVLAAHLKWNTVNVAVMLRKEGGGLLSKLLSGGDTSTNSLFHPIPSHPWCPDWNSHQDLIHLSFLKCWLQLFCAFC